MPENDPQTVDLDPAAADAIAAKVNATEPEWAKALKAQLTASQTETAELKAMLAAPQRTVIEDGGVKDKAGSAPAITGGDDKYSTVGDDDAEVATNLYLMSKMLGAVGKSISPRAEHVMLTAGEAALKGAAKPINAPGSAFLKGQYIAMRGEARTKAMVSTTAGSGDEWVPTLSSAELWRDTHLATQVAGLIRRVDMPSNPYDLPTQTADTSFYYASTENVAVTASNLTTAKATLTARKIQAEVNFSGEVTEDSIIPLVPAIRADLVRRGAQTIDDLIVHGDTETGGTGNVNSDNGAPSAGSFYLALDGLRKFAVVTNSGQTSNVAAAVTAANFNTIRGLLGKYGARPSDLAVVTGTSTYLSMLTISEVLTQEKYGAGATILQGELARLYNIPIFLSEAIASRSWDKIEADGKSNTTVGTLGWLVLFNRNHWTAGFRRDFQIESFRDIQKDMNILVASFRMGLTSSGIATTHTATGRNITV